MASIYCNMLHKYDTGEAPLTTRSLPDVDFGRFGSNDVILNITQLYKLDKRQRSLVYKRYLRRDN